MDRVTKGIVAILIREIQDIIAEGGLQRIAKIEALLDSWITANHLRPEEVATFVDRAVLIKRLEELGREWA